MLAKLSTFYISDLLGHISDGESSTTLDSSHFKYIGIHNLLSLFGTPTWFLLLLKFVHGCTPLLLANGSTFNLLGTPSFAFSNIGTSPAAAK